MNPENPSQDAYAMAPPEEKKFNIPLLVGAVAILVGIGIGVFGATLFGKATTNTTTSTTNATISVSPEEEINPAAIASESKAADLRMVLNTLYRSHINLLISAVRSNLQEKQDYQAAYTVLNQNATALAAALGSIYGPDAEQRFFTLWSAQNESYINYTVAVKNDKQIDKDKAVADLNVLLNEQASLYSELSPNLPREGILSLLNAQSIAIKASIDGYNLKDYTLSYNQEQQAANQSNNIADTLTTSIVKQYPEKF